MSRDRGPPSLPPGSEPGRADEFGIGGLMIAMSTPHIRTASDRRLCIIVAGLFSAWTLLLAASAGGGGPSGMAPAWALETREPPRPTTPPEEEPPDGDWGVRPLTAKEINRIRFLELRALRTDTDLPDRVSVKIPPRVIDDFLADMREDPLFEDEEGRSEFRRLTPPQKLHVMAQQKEKALPYIDRLEISTDPEVFVEFRKRVLPSVLRGCATSGCHVKDSASETKFYLLTDPVKDPGPAYGDFVILCELEVDGRPLINRERPEESLLLNYLLPAKEVKRDFRHPGDLEIPPVFRTRTANSYRRIEKWIASLRRPAPDYGVRLLPEPPSTQSDESPEREAVQP